MTGYAVLIGSCYACRRTITCHPRLVPSVRNQPVCRSCMDQVNGMRRDAGLEEIKIHPRAYEAAEESEL